MLDAGQIAAVLTSLDLLYVLPDWAATSLSAVLVTQANTWQWVSHDCLLPGSSDVSGAVLQLVMAILLPGKGQLQACCVAHKAQEA